jgi:hypothetical protein
MAVSDIRAFVYRVIDVFPGPLKTPARWVADRVFGVWEEIFNHLSMFRAPWLFIQDKLQAMVSAAFWALEETARTMRWLVTLALPRWANWALDVAVDIGRKELNSFRNWASGTINDVRRFCSDLAWRGINAARDAVNWARGAVENVWTTLRVVRDKVIGLLGAPEALVDWIFAAMWRRFWRFLNDHAEAIAATAWNRRDTIIAQSLRRLEDWILRVL